MSEDEYYIKYEVVMMTGCNEVLSSSQPL